MFLTYLPINLQVKLVTSLSGCSYLYTVSGCLSISSLVRLSCPSSGIVRHAAMRQSILLHCKAFMMLNLLLFQQGKRGRAGSPGVSGAPGPKVTEYSRVHETRVSQRCEKELCFSVNHTQKGRFMEEKFCGKKLLFFNPYSRQ